MRDELDMRLRDAQRRALRFNEIAALLKQMQFDREELEKAISEYKTALAGASLEVYKLETKAASLFDSMLKKADKRLEMECNNTAAARLRLSRAEKELRELDLSIEGLKEESLRLSGSGDEYESLYEQKKRMLIAGGGTGAQLIVDLAGNIDTAKTRLKEIREAYKTCERAISYLESSHKKLEKAKEWGVVDMMGGKFISSSIKHDHIKNAVIDANSAKALLNDIKTTEAGISTQIDIKSTSAGRFADIYMDNIAVDMFVQKRIDASMGNIAAVKSDLRSRLCRLMVMEHREKKELDDKQNKLDSIILGFERSEG